MNNKGGGQVHAFLIQVLTWFAFVIREEIVHWLMQYVLYVAEMCVL